MTGCPESLDFRESVIMPTQTVREFSKVNLKKPTVFTYNQLEDTMGEKTPFTIATKEYNT